MVNPPTNRTKQVDLEAELLDRIGSSEFSQSIRKIAKRFQGSLLGGYYIKNSQGLLEHFSWNEADQKFSRTAINTTVKEECILLEEYTQTDHQRPETSTVKEFKNALLKAIQLHHLYHGFEHASFDDSQLTQRENEILKHILLYEDNKSIASKLKISPRTVEKHCQNIFEKLEAENRNALIYKVSVSENLNQK